MQPMWLIKYKATLAAVFMAVIVLSATFAYYSLVKPRIPIVIFRYTETITVRNNGAEPVTFGGLSTESFLDFSWQRLGAVYVSQDYEDSRDKDGNPLLLIDGPPQLGSNEIYSITVTWDVESFPRRIPGLSVKQAGKISEIPLSLVNYTREVAPWKSPPSIRLNTTIWDSTEFYNLTLREASVKLGEESENVLEILLKDVGWISTHVEYFSAEPTYPVETARNGKGDCDDQSNLLIALLRAQGIPSFLMMGYVHLPDETYGNITGRGMNGHLFYEASHTLGHAWAMVYVPPWGWLPCDPVLADSAYPYRPIVEAIVLRPETLVFKNVTGVYELEGTDYIGSSREETRTAEEKDIYFKLSMDMRQLPMPEHIVLLRSPTSVFFIESVCLMALVTAAAIYDNRKTMFPTGHLRPIYCIHCGARNPSDTIYCGICGQRACKSSS